MKKCNRLDLVAKLFNEMNQTGIEPNEITAGTLMQAYGDSSQLDHCFQVSYIHIFIISFIPFLPFFPCITYLLDGKNDIAKIFNAFKGKYDTLSAVAYNIMIGCCLSNKRPDLAMQLLDGIYAMDGGRGREGSGRVARNKLCLITTQK